MHERDLPQRTSSEESTNVSELNEWRRIKVDPMLDNHQAILLGAGEKPGLVLSHGLLSGKFDTLIQIGKVVILLIGIFGTIISAFEVAGPWLRTRLGIPITYSTPAQPDAGVQSSQPQHSDVLPGKAY
jgi:hypothetical protein